jgi:hypothetical protein
LIRKKLFRDEIRVTPSGQLLLTAAASARHTLLGALYGTLHDRLVDRRFRHEPAHPFVVAAYCGPHIVLVWLLPCLALPGFPSRLLYRLPSAAAAAAAAAAASTAQSTATGLRATVSGP